MPPEALISIVTPAYNAAPFIEETARSVLAQTFPSWEWVIVDDGSSDRTVEIISSLEDPRIRLIRAVHSGLPAVARNIGIRESRGALIAFLDADDIWAPTKLHAHFERLNSDEGQDLVFSSMYLSIDRRKRPRMILPRGGVPSTRVDMILQLCKANIIGCSTVMVRRNALEAVGLFNEDPRLRGTEDFDLWLRLAAQISIGFIPAPLTYYRMHSAGLSGRERQIVEGRIFAIENAIQRDPALLTNAFGSAKQKEAAYSEWRGYGALFDGADNLGRTWFRAALKDAPFSRTAWTGLAMSFLGRRVLSLLRRFSRIVW